MYVKNRLAQIKDQYNFKIFYPNLVENISSNINHAWKTDGSNPIFNQ